MEKTKNASAKKIASLAVLTATSLIVFIIENLFPPLFIPGAKLGLGNVFTLLCLVLFSPAYAFILIAVRTVLGCLLVGNASSILFSLPAGLAATACEAILIRFLHPKISLIAVSVVGSVCHATVQNLVFCLINGKIYMLSYLPYLALIAVFSGVFVGAVVYLLIHKVPSSFYRKIILERSETP